MITSAALSTLTESRSSELKSNPVPGSFSPAWEGLMSATGGKIPISVVSSKTVASPLLSISSLLPGSTNSSSSSNTTLCSAKKSAFLYASCISRNFSGSSSGLILCASAAYARLIALISSVGSMPRTDQNDGFIYLPNAYSCESPSN